MRQYVILNEFEVSQIAGRFIIFPPGTKRYQIFEDGECVTNMDVPGYPFGGTVSQVSLDDIMKYNEWVINTTSIIIPKGTPLQYKNNISFISEEMKVISTTNMDVLK